MARNQKAETNGDRPLWLLASYYTLCWRLGLLEFSSILKCSKLQTRKREYITSVRVMNLSEFLFDLSFSLQRRDLFVFVRSQRCFMLTPYKVHPTKRLNNENNLFQSRALNYCHMCMCILLLFSIAGMSSLLNFMVFFHPPCISI